MLRDALKKSKILTCVDYGIFIKEGEILNRMKQRNNQYLTVVFINPGRAFNGDNKSQLGTAAGGK